MPDPMSVERFTYLVRMLENPNDLPRYDLQYIAGELRDEVQRLRTRLDYYERLCRRRGECLAAADKKLERLAAAESVGRGYQNYLDSGSYVSSQALSLAMERWQALRGGANDAS